MEEVEEMEDVKEMDQGIVLAFIILLLAMASSCGGSHGAPQETDLVEAERDALISDWFPRIIDYEAGGYFTNFSHDWTKEKDQPKMIVSQARGLWTAARAYACTEDPSLIAAAEHGYDFLTGSMWDPVHGGFLQHWSDRASSENKPKMAYGNAFAIYALAQYAKVVKDNSQILAWCQQSLDWLDYAAHDDRSGGYFNLIGRDGKSAKFENLNRSQFPDNYWGDPTWKDQNSSIHLMEAFTTLYEVMPTAQSRSRLLEMLTLVRDTMVGPRGHLHLYFERDWTPIDHSRKGRDYILEHLRHDHVSFGHDIETAYLLVDAAEKLYGTCDSLTLQVAKQLVDHSLDYGFDQGFYGILDKGYYFLGDESPEIVDSNKVWWSQAEAWHALVLFSRIFPDDSRYPMAAKSMWTYIQEQIIDQEKGGWYPAGLDVDPKNKFARKAQQWKSCYHDGRALMQVAEYNR